jgi:cytochrome c oxidase cbb3-type subunit III
MSDFTSAFWPAYIAIISVVSILACAVVLRSQTKRRVKGAQVDTTGHVWDEDLQEWNNPLPRWWMWLFYITIVFALVYLLFYPGLAAYGGRLGWTSAGQYDAERTKADATYSPIFAKYQGMPIPEIAADPDAMAIAQNLFLQTCAQCHASDARGSKGFPNLADGDWLWGGDPKQIEETILNGRTGVMPALGQALGPDGTKDVAHYVMSLSGLPNDSIRTARGQEKFQQTCVACHGADGKGNPALGAPDLTDRTWLYGGAEPDIIATITNGRSGQMPAHKDFLGEAKAHLLAAYVWSLSHPEVAKRASK